MEELEYMHGQSAIHRDLKPENVMATSAGVLKLTDFGYAKQIQANITASHEAFGTPSYMAPEQGIQSNRVTPAADEYSLGVMIYELLCGHPPFEGDFIEVLMAHRDETPPPLSGALWPVLEKMLAKRPEERFGSIAAAREALLMGLTS